MLIYASPLFPDSLRMAVSKTRENPPQTNVMTTIMVIHVAAVMGGSSASRRPDGRWVCSIPARPRANPKVRIAARVRWRKGVGGASDSEPVGQDRSRLFGAVALSLDSDRHTGHGHRDITRIRSLHHRYDRPVHPNIVDLDLEADIPPNGVDHDHPVDTGPAGYRS